jgi:hypothetical protein
VAVARLGEAVNHTRTLRSPTSSSRQEFAGDRAYVVLNVTYSIESRGVPAQAAAQMKFALRKEADG